MPARRPHGRWQRPRNRKFLASASLFSLKRNTWGRLTCFATSVILMAETCHRFDPLPQVLENVRCKDGKLLEREVSNAIKDGEARLDGHGRLVVRLSGTEPVIRVMGEGDDKVLVEEIVDGIVNALTEAA